MKSIEQLKQQLKILRDNFGDSAISNGNLQDLQKFFKDKFNHDIVQIGDCMIFDFSSLFKICPALAKEFKRDHIQPITVTYKRLDIIFYTYDKHPEKGEQYIIFDSDWSKYLYPLEIKQSVLFAHKEYLREKLPDEYYLQVNLFDIKSKYTKYIKDINWDAGN